LTQSLYTIGRKKLQADFAKSIEHRAGGLEANPRSRRNQSKKWAEPAMVVTAAPPKQ
jgi:hypothetical protein